MNREIKFRVFCKKHNRMEFYSLGSLICGETTSENGEGGLFKGETWSQYTGLKDKNGKEIYEGDIVKEIYTLYDWDKPDGEEAYQSERVSQIEYRDHGFWIKAEGFGWEGEGLWNWDNIEVIGNVYQNP